MAFNWTTFRKLYPFRSHFMDRNGLAYHYLDEGQGPPVVLLHGNPTWSFFYREVVKALAPEFRVIVPDHIGCGFSDKPGDGLYGYRLQHRVDDLGALFDHLGLEDNVTLIAHDWGGMIGMAYAVEHPGRFARFVLMNTAAFFPPASKKIPLRLKLIRDTKTFGAFAVQGGNLFARAALWMAARGRLAPDVKRGLVAPYNSWQHRIATLRFVQDIPLAPDDPSYALVQKTADRLTEFRDHPVRFIWGRHDFVFDEDYLIEWQRRFPKAQTNLLENAGHYLLEDQPDQVVTHIKTFLARATNGCARKELH